MQQAEQQSVTIDRASPEPFYLQLTRIIEGSIERGEYAAGERLPAESEFCRNYDLARSTVRETLRTLEDRNRIKVVPRRGAFVVDPERTGWVLQVAAGFFEGEVHHDQRTVETDVLDAERTTLSGAAARALKLEDGSAGFKLSRLRRLDGKMALYSINYLLADIAPLVLESDVMERHGSLNRVLRNAGYRIYGARRSVEAVAAPAHVASLLGVPENFPLLLVTSVSWGKNKKPFDYYTSWVRTDIVKVTVEASASDNASKSNG